MDAGAIDRGNPIRDGATLDDEVRVDVGPRNQHEGPFQRPRVRQRQRRIVARYVVIRQNIDIEGPRPPPFGLLTPSLDFTPLSDEEQGRRCQRGFENRYGIEEVTLFRSTYGIGFVHGRYLNVPDLGGAPQSSQRSAKMSEAVADIRPQPQSGVHSTGHRSRSTVTATSENGTPTGASGL